MIVISFFALFFLFFFQLLTDFIEAIYAFGLLGTDIPPELGFILLLFTPIFLFAFRKRIPHKLLPALGWIVLLSRAIEPMLDTRLRMIVSGIGVGAFLLFLPALLIKQANDEIHIAVPFIGSGLALAVSVSITLHSLGAGIDPSTSKATAWIGWLLVIVTIPLLHQTLRLNAQQGAPYDAGKKASTGKIIMLSLGMTASITLLYFSFIAPHVILRWAGEENSLLFFVILASSLTIFSLLLLLRDSFAALTTRGKLFGLVLLFAIVLELTIFPHQLHFPANPQSYPVYQPTLSLLARLPLFLLPVFLPSVFLAFLALYQELMTARPGISQLASAFTISSLFFLVMVFAQIFTTVYDYIPVVGPFFRDKFWLVYLTLEVVLILSLLFINPKSRVSSLIKEDFNTIFFPTLVFLLSLVIIGGEAFSPIAPTTEDANPNTLRVMTYNIQQGYSESGTKNMDEQIEVIKAVKPDILGLQESDSARIANGNTDLVRYFAKRLNMYAYYGPNTVVGTFGIALLSKYPIENPKTFYMYSEGEQTAAIQAQITKSNKTFNVFVTHLGNGGPFIQQEEVLGVVDNLSDVILMGDFNFEPNTPQYQNTCKLLDDAWLLGTNGETDTNINPKNRIDHIFVTPGTEILDSQFILSPASDHPALWAEIGW